MRRSLTNYNITRAALFHNILMNPSAPMRAVVVADTALATQQVLTLPGEAADTTLVLAEAIGLPSIRRLVA